MPVAPVAPAPPDAARPPSRPAVAAPKLVEPPATLADLPTPPAGELPSLACRFEAVREVPGQPPVRWEWLLWRRSRQVETRETLGDAGERWHRAAAGGVEMYEKLFHRERRVIEYTEGDLRALGTHRSWAIVTSILDPELLARDLRKAADVTSFGRPAERRVGTIDCFEYDVTWIPSLGLPSVLRRAGNGSLTTFRLKEVDPVDASPWQAPDSSAYGRDEFSDIGDKTTDPFLRQFHGKPGWVHPGCK